MKTKLTKEECFVLELLSLEILGKPLCRATSSKDLRVLNNARINCIKNN